MAQDALQAKTLIEKLRFEIARLKRAQFGTSSEKMGDRIGQLELAIEALETDVAERLAAAPVVVEAASPKPARRPLPVHLPRETVVHPGPCACPSWGGRLRRIGEDLTETLDYVPGRFKRSPAGSARAWSRRLHPIMPSPAAVPILSGRSELAGAFRYMLARWTALTRVFDDGRIALDNNPAERALRGVAIGRKNYLFAGSERGADRAAAMYSLIESAKLNGIDPEAYLRDVLTRIADHPAEGLNELLPWNWTATPSAALAA